MNHVYSKDIELNNGLGNDDLWVIYYPGGAFRLPLCSGCLLSLR